ncbi:hypothetical protein C8Q74DRAFT_838080 [Fomes fomentarius]|nr:hypothetical protein C8Q74DRAFT_838080 [Fomes fomentarius]
MQYPLRRITSTPNAIVGCLPMLFLIATAQGDTSGLFAINKPGGLACQFCVGQGRELRRSGHRRPHKRAVWYADSILANTASSSDFRTACLSASRSPGESCHLPSPSPTTSSHGMRTACLCSVMMSRRISSQHPEGADFARCHTNHSSRPTRIVDRTGMAVNVSLTAAAQCLRRSSSGVDAPAHVSRAPSAQHGQRGKVAPGRQRLRR